MLCKAGSQKAESACQYSRHPDLCDFYLGSVVKKGDLKIAISTNGKSPYPGQTNAPVF
jgi:siroheme synthase (precorrin-2 oxidase/ferrochelatase)